MAVSIPSDLIVDVMRNADPERVRTAVARLQSASGTQLADAANNTGTATFADVMTAVQVPPAGTAGQGSDQALAGFERMVISNLLEGILPPESSGLYGRGNAGSIWRSMFADQLAGVYVEQGGLGLGQMIVRDVQVGEATPERGWPYFEMNQITGFVS